MLPGIVRDPLGMQPRRMFMMKNYGKVIIRTSWNNFSKS